MNSNERTKLLETVINHFGRPNQMDMIIEECAELIQAINKYRRHPDENTGLHLCGEIADVEIMLEQARIMFDQLNQVDDIKNRKLLGLSEYVNFKPNPQNNEIEKSYPKEEERS